MKITYDKKVDAAYIYLIPNFEIKSGWVKKTYYCEPKEVGSIINLDFNILDQLGGIEILEASKKLPKEILEKAEMI